MRFFGLVFIVTTTCVFIFKKEKETESVDSLEDTLTLKQTYKLVAQIVSLPSVKKLTLLLLTSKVKPKLKYLKIFKILKLKIGSIWYSINGLFKTNRERSIEREFGAFGNTSNSVRNCLAIVD